MSVSWNFSGVWFFATTGSRKCVEREVDMDHVPSGTMNGPNRGLILEALLAYQEQCMYVMRTLDEEGGSDHANSVAYQTYMALEQEITKFRCERTWTTDPLLQITERCNQPRRTQYARFCVGHDVVDGVVLVKKGTVYGPK